MGFILIANRARNHQNYIISFKFWIKTFIFHIHIYVNYDLAKISKSQKITLTCIFSHFSIWCCVQKHVVLIECITYINAVGYPPSWIVAHVPLESNSQFKLVLWLHDFHYFMLFYLAPHSSQLEYVANTMLDPMVHYFRSHYWQINHGRVLPLC